MDISTPLKGVRILAVSQFGAGPYGTMLLADLGAEVIKIEDPSVGGDVSRSVPPYTTKDDSLYFQSFNRNKKSFTLNLNSAEGKEILHGLVRISDVMFNNLRGDQVSKLGLDFQSLSHVNPKIVCCSLTGFGVAGARAGEPGYDHLMQASVGYMSLTGDPSGPPSSCGVAVIDHAAGLAAALGVIAALYSSAQTGEGRQVEVSLFDTALSMLTYLACWNLNKGFSPVRRTGSAHQTLVPVQAFETSDDRIFIFCGKEKFWKKLCIALEAPELMEDERFVDFPSRRQNRELTIETLQKIFRTRTTEDWLARLRGKVPCAPVNDLSHALADPFLQDRGVVIETDHPVFGKVKQIASPIRVSGPGVEHRRAPQLGEHTVQIMEEYLGYSRDEIRRFQSAGII